MMIVEKLKATFINLLFNILLQVHPLPLVNISFILATMENSMESESEVTQSCLTLCDPMDCSPPGSSDCRILQARTLEWVAISFSRGSSRPRD